MDLDILRSRPDFQALLAEVRRSAPTPGSDASLPLPPPCESRPDDPGSE